MLQYITEQGIIAIHFYTKYWQIYFNRRKIILRLLSYHQLI